MSATTASVRWLDRADLIAGLSIAGLLLPEAVAYAGIAGLPPQAGIIALFAGLVCYGLCGTSRFAIVSATSSSAAVLFAAASALAGPDTALRLAMTGGLILMSGAFFVLAGLTGLGGISTFIAKPVLRGFAFGLALTIVIRQLAVVVAVSIRPGNTLHFAQDLLLQWPRWNLTSLAIALAALLMLRLLARWRALPGALLVIAFGIALDVSGITRAQGIATVGDISLALTWPGLPALASNDWLRLSGLAFALTLILYAESYGSISTFALRHGDSAAPSRDLLALGLANLVSGLFHGMPTGAGYSATSANEAAGAESRRAGWVAAVVILLLVLTLLPWIARTPTPVLAAIVIHAVSHTLRLDTLRPYFAWRRDRTIVLAAIASVLLLGVLNGLLAAIGVSLVLMLHSFSEPRVSWLGRLADSHDYIDTRRHNEAVAPAGILIARPDLPLFFANADSLFAVIRAGIEQATGIHTIIVSLEESPDLDGTSLEALCNFADLVRQRGQRLMLARVKDQVRDLLARTQPAALAGVSHEAWSVDDAVQEARHPALNG